MRSERLPLAELEPTEVDDIRDDERADPELRKHLLQESRRDDVHVGRSERTSSQRGPLQMIGRLAAVIVEDDRLAKEPGDDDRGQGGEQKRRVRRREQMHDVGTAELAGWQIVFDTPAMVMATCFVALPLVIREVVPVLHEIGDDQEQAARSLGAGAYQTFRRITLPSIKRAVVYGVVLSLARSLGEFGAVKVVSGNITGRTQTATLVVEQKYQNFQQETAYATSFLLIFVSIACLIVVAFLRPKSTP